MASLIDAQIRAGAELRRAIGRASALPDLEVLRPALSAWSADNERVLAEVFGESERRAYRRMTASRAPVTDSFKDERLQMARTIDSRLHYLQAAVVRIDLARELARAPTRKPWWRPLGGGP
jgi:hypothetical protein